jgi:NAD(P)-dependent dehydrogenase (short-subunit alcohol dehydrogenase family)
MDTSENIDPLKGGGSLSTDKVAVVTGASSGIGRATAHEFARRGFRVVVAARNKPSLDEVVEECRLLGSDALAVQVDVTNEEDVNELALAASEKFGRIDTWVNNASVTLFGRFDEVPTDDIRKVVETNLFGYIYGARAVIPHFRRQGSGVLINISSVVAVTGQPFTGAYAATKAAEKALSESLSQELADEENIYVCAVMPGVIDTPLFQHGANYMGKEPVPPKPIQPPEMVAEAIVNLSENPKIEIFVGSPGHLRYIAKAIAPRMFDKILRNGIEKDHFRDNAAEPTSGNLYDYAIDQVSGGWREQLYQESADRKFNVSMILAGACLGLLTMWGLKRSSASVRT